MTEAPSTPAAAAPGRSAVRAGAAGRRKATLGKKLLLLLGSLVFTLVLAEVCVRLLVPVRSVGPIGSHYDPVYGKSLKKSYSVWRHSPEFTYLLSTNSLGFRGPEPAAAPKRPVLFLGDSMTMGTGVSDGEEYPQLVGAMLAERAGPAYATVVNAGVANTGNGRWVKFLRNEGPRLEPRYVFLQIFPNDFRDNAREHLFRLSESGELQEPPVPPRGSLDRLQAIVESIPLVRHSYLMALVRQTVSNLAARGAAEPSPEKIARHNALTYRIIEEALRTCRDHGWPVAGILAESARWEYDDDQRLEIQGLFERYDAPLLAVPSKVQRPDLYFEVDPHWNTGGHRAVAETVVLQLLGDARFIQPEATPSGG